MKPVPKVFRLWKIFASLFDSIKKMLEYLVKEEDFFYFIDLKIACTCLAHLAISPLA